MPHPFFYTAIGSIAVLIWGMSIAWNRPIIASLGWVNSLIVLHLLQAIFGFALWTLLGRSKQICDGVKSKWLYVRAIAYLISAFGFYISISLVSDERLSITILINYLWPTLILCFSVTLLKIPITHPRWFTLGTLLVVTSMSIELTHDYKRMLYLVSSSNYTDILAYVFAFVGAIGWAMYSTISRKWGDISGGITSIPFISLIIVIVALIVLCTSKQPNFVWSSDLTYLTWIATIANIIGGLTWYLGVERGNIIVLSLIADFMPWISLTTAYFLLNTPINSSTIWTALLLVAGAIMTRFGTMVIKR